MLSIAGIAWPVFPPCPREKIDVLQPTASSPAAACPCGYREVNKLKTKQVTKCNKGHRGVNRAVFKEDLPVGPLPPKEGKAERGTLIRVPAR